MNNQLKYNIAVLVSTNRDWEHWRDDYIWKKQKSQNEDVLTHHRNYIENGEFKFIRIINEEQTYGMKISGIVEHPNAYKHKRYDELKHVLDIGMIRR